MVSGAQVTNPITPDQPATSFSKEECLAGIQSLPQVYIYLGGSGFVGSGNYGVGQGLRFAEEQGIVWTTMQIPSTVSELKVVPYAANLDGTYSIPSKVNQRDNTITYLENNYLQGARITIFGYSSGADTAVMLADEYDNRYPGNVDAVVSIGGTMTYETIPGDRDSQTIIDYPPIFQRLQGNGTDILVIDDNIFADPGVVDPSLPPGTDLWLEIELEDSKDARESYFWSNYQNSDPNAEGRWCLADVQNLLHIDLSFTVNQLPTSAVNVNIPLRNSVLGWIDDTVACNTISALDG
jgi:hypothetical protein